MDYDILIVGAGPAGLCLARALSGKGLRIGITDNKINTFDVLIIHEVYSIAAATAYTNHF